MGTVDGELSEREFGAGWTPSALIDVVADPAASQNLTRQHTDRCQNELLSMTPGHADQIDPSTHAGCLAALNRGIRLRSIHQHAALRDDATASYLHQLAGLGSQVRITPSVPGPALVIDRQVALLRLPDAADSAIAVVHEPNIVSWLLASFEQLWAQATPFGHTAGQQAGGEVGLGQIRAAILRLMAEGEKDEAISRRLSISVRTCRRHIADYMAAVGATSRFQAGVIAARAGHLES